MGWTYTSAYRGGGIRAYLDRHFASENEAGKREILDSGLVRMRRYYAAMRWTNKTRNEVRTLAIVCLALLRRKLVRAEQAAGLPQRPRQIVER